MQEFKGKDLAKEKPTILVLEDSSRVRIAVVVSQRWGKHRKGIDMVTCSHAHLVTGQLSKG